MNLREIWQGTPEEVMAAQRVEELKAKQPLNQRQKSQLDSNQGITRRRLLRRGLVVGGGAVVIGTGTKTALEFLAGSEEGQVLAELETLPINEQVRKIDTFYSAHLLSLQVAQRVVVPIWVNSFISNSRSQLNPQDILPKVQYTIEKKSDESREGGVQVRPDTQTVSNPSFNFEYAPSNQMKRNANEDAKGIVVLRSIFIHELSHLDTIFKDHTAMAQYLIDRKFLNTEVTKPEKSFVNGFTLFLRDPKDQSHRIFFAGLDEAATDICGAHINSKAGVPTMLTYTTGVYLRKFLSWINYDMDRFVSLHKSSDLETLARDLGKLVIKINKLDSSDSQADLVEGMKVITSFNNPDPNSLEALFPGFKNAVTNTQVTFLVR